MKSPIVQFFFRFMWIKRGIGVVVIMLWVLSSSVVHAKNNPFAPADQVGPYKIGYKRVQLVDSSRDAAFGGRTLVTHIWYPIDDANAAGAMPAIYDAGLASLALFGIPVSHIITRSQFGALVDASSTLPPSGNIPGACTAPPFPPDPADPCGTSVIVGLPISSRGPFPLLMFSHGSGGDASGYVSLTEYLASHGYIVVTPEHTGNRFVDSIVGLCETLPIPSRPCTDAAAKILADRPQDIRFVLDQVLAGHASVDPAVIDASRIGMYGHSAGGYTTLVVAGGTVSGTLPDSRIKAIAPLSPPASAIAVLDPGLVPLTGNIEVPTLISFGTADISSGINLVDQGREIFTDLNTQAVGEKYRVEIQRGVHTGFTNICAFTAGNLEVIQQGNASPIDFPILAALLTYDIQIPQLLDSAPAFIGKANSGPQSICSPNLFYSPANFAVWDAVPLPGTAVPLSALLFPAELIPGYIDPTSLAYTPSLASSKHLQIVDTDVVAFFNKHLKGDMRYHRYLLPSYAHAKKLAAEVEYCKATPGKAEVCFDKHSRE